MKKLFSIILIMVLLLTLCSCAYSEAEIQEIHDMFASFEHNDNYVLLTHFELVIKGKRYKREDIKYNEKVSNIVFLEQDGYYSYTYDEESLLVEFLYTDYEKLEAEKIGALELRAKLLDVLWFDNCYWIDTKDPSFENSVYYCWNINSKRMTVEENFYIEQYLKFDDDNFRNNHFVLESESTMFGGWLNVTDKNSNIKKTIDKSILEKFEEGKKISSCKSSTIFQPGKVFIDERNFYITLAFGAGFLSDHYYCYVIKWNFDTEEVSYYTSVYFEYYQEWVDDIIILE